jgi:hypothetical protein
MCNSPLPFFPMIESSLGNLKIRQSLNTHAITIEIKNSNLWGLDTKQIEMNKNLIHFVDSGEVVGIKVFSEAIIMTEDNFRYKPWIFVDTKFKRKNQPIFSLAATEYFRRIQLPKEILNLPIESQIPGVKQIIRNHFSDTGGEIPMWGKIHYYKFFYAKDQSITFGLNGGVIAQGSDIPPPQAKLLVNGKRLF